MCVCQSEHASISLRASGGVCATRAVNRCVPAGCLLWVCTTSGWPYKQGCAHRGCACTGGTSRPVHPHRAHSGRVAGARRAGCGQHGHPPAARSPQPSRRSIPSRSVPPRPAPRGAVRGRTRSSGRRAQSRQCPPRCGAAQPRPAPRRRRRRRGPAPPHRTAPPPPGPAPPPPPGECPPHRSAPRRLLHRHRHRGGAAAPAPPARAGPQRCARVRASPRARFLPPRCECRCCAAVPALLRLSPSPLGLRTPNPSGVRPHCGGAAVSPGGAPCVGASLHTFLACHQPPPPPYH